MFNLIRKCQNNSVKCLDLFTMSKNTHNWEYPQLVLSIFLILAVLADVEFYLIIVLIYNFLKVNFVEHVPMYLLDIHFFVKCVFISFEYQLTICCRSNLQLSILHPWPMCLSLHKYRTLLTTVASKKILKSCSRSPPTLFFFRIILAVQDPLHFHKTLQHELTNFFINVCYDFIETELNL